MTGACATTAIFVLSTSVSALAQPAMRTNAFTLGAVVQLDGRFGLVDPQDYVDDTVLLRRLRPIFQARLARRFEFRLMPDFGNHTTAIFDAYVDVRLTPTIRIRVGKDKGPVGLERLYSGASLLFPERTLVTNLVPNRDVGVQVQGELGGALSYRAGLFHGVADVASTDLSAGFGNDFNGNMVVRPLSHSSSTPWRNFGFAIGGTAGHASGTLPVYRSATQQPFFEYAVDATADGVQTRVSPSAFYYYRSFGAFSEYARSSEAVSRAGGISDVTNTGWEVSGAVAVTGESVSERGIVPARPFSRSQHHWGAVEIAARYNRLRVDPLIFSRALAAPSALGGATAAGVAVHWFVTTSVKSVLSFERTTFDDSPHTHRPPENALTFRLQLNLQPTL